MAKPEIIKYADVLDRAHNEFTNLYIKTELKRIPSPDNGELAVVKAWVGGWRGDVEYGPFEGHGDASPNEVGAKRNTPAHDAPIRMAETRAKARALKDLVNIRGTLAEDASDHQGEEPPTPLRSETGGRRGSEGPSRGRPSEDDQRPLNEPDESSEYVALITDAQLKMINDLAKELGDGDSFKVLDWLEDQYGYPVEMTNEVEAGQIIELLNTRKAARRNKAGEQV